MVSRSQPGLRVLLDPSQLRRRMAEDVREGLTASPKFLKPKYFYDARGSRLFEAITRLPEYYLTRAELEILERDAVDLAGEGPWEEIVELGSGSSRKTERLLDAGRRHDGLRRYVAVDVSPEALREAAGRLSRKFPGLEVVPVVADLESHLHLLGVAPRRLAVFLGSSLGNFDPHEARAFLQEVRSLLDAGGGLLLGLDLVKDAAVLEAAYDDSQGVTAAFNRNVLHVLNRELDGDFDPGAFEHRARYDAGRAVVEMFLVSTRRQRVRLRALDLDVEFEAGEPLRTERSYKYTRETASRLLEAAGFRLASWRTDAAGRFSLSVARPAEPPEVGA